MDKNFRELFEKIRNYMDNDILESEPKKMLYINSYALNLINLSNSISEKTQKPLEEIDVADVSTYYIDLSTTLHLSVLSAINKYIKAKDITNGLSTKERNSLKKDVSSELSTFLANIKDVLASSGALDHARIRHNVNMSKLNLPRLKVEPEQIENEFDIKKNITLPLPVLATKAAFWVNKAVKYIDTTKISLLLFDRNDLVYSKENYDQLSDKEKIIAIYKDKILSRLKNSVSQDLPSERNFTDLVTIFYAGQLYKETKNFQSIEDTIAHYGKRYGIDDNIHDFYLEEVELMYNSLSDIQEFQKEYDSLFPSKDNDSSFLKDLITTCSIYDLKDKLYTSKSYLMVLLGYQLLEQKRTPVPLIKHYGKKYDPRLKTEILCLDLPNHFMPACFHFDQKLLSLDVFEDFNNLPEYKTFFNDVDAEKYSTPLLFAPTAEQKKYIKDEYKKAKNHPDSQRTKILSQMNGMANGTWRDFDDLMSKNINH